VRTPTYLDCCDRPDLNGLRVLYQSSHDMESLGRCASCGTYWFYRFHEYVTWSAGGDEVTSWFTRLTEDEGERLRRTTDRDAEDLSYLTTRASWIDDANGVERVTGAPDHPWS
jgi:hypothetical protein